MSTYFEYAMAGCCAFLTGRESVSATQENGKDGVTYLTGGC
jgi:hypothetical protein